ncbi:MAG: hypothetical protein IT195_01610 [Microthrixaceae bacterium]|nr:hypothetical protein [Microthrixaceae bacterium]
MSGGRRRKSRNQRRQGAAAVSIDYWGSDHDDAESDLPMIRASAMPSAMVRSLGRPPLHGHDQAAETYFEVVYARAALLASALADSVGLLEHPDDED